MEDKHIIAATVGGGALILCIGILIVRSTANRGSSIAPTELPSRAIPDVQSAEKSLAHNANVQLQIDPKFTPGKRYVVTGSTNLPVGTHLMISVLRDGPEGEFDGKTDVLEGGRFESQTLGPENGLEPAEYRISITVPIPKVQPASVRKIIGEQGENLRGPLVESGRLGPVIRAKTVLRVPGELPAPRTDSIFVAAGRGELLSNPVDGPPTQAATFLTPSTN